MAFLLPYSTGHPLWMSQYISYLKTTSIQHRVFPFIFIIKQLTDFHIMVVLQLLGLDQTLKGHRGIASKKVNIHFAWNKNHGRYITEVMKMGFVISSRVSIISSNIISGALKEKRFSNYYIQRISMSSLCLGLLLIVA